MLSCKNINESPKIDRITDAFFYGNMVEEKKHSGYCWYKRQEKLELYNHSTDLPNMGQLKMYYSLKLLNASKMIGFTVKR